jgi:hypothetical protein
MKISKFSCCSAAGKFLGAKIEKCQKRVLLRLKNEIFAKCRFPENVQEMVLHRLLPYFVYL